MWKLNKYSYKSGYTILMIFGGCLSLYFYNGSDHTPLNLYYLTNHYAGLYGESFYFILLVYRIYIFKQLRSLTLIRLKTAILYTAVFSIYDESLCSFSDFIRSYAGDWLVLYNLLFYAILLFCIAFPTIFHDRINSSFHNICE